MMNSKKIILLFSLSLLNYFAYTQNKKNIREVTQEVATKPQVPTEISVSEIRINPKEIYKIERRNLNFFEQPQVQLKNIKTEKLSSPIYPDTIQFPNSITPTVFISIERKQAFASILIPQYVQHDDKSIEKVLSYEIEITENPVAHKTTGNRVYAQNSVLASGNFYRIAINKQGLYKIDYNFIKNNLGVNPSSVQLNNIRLYGNGGEMLDENNATFRIDDLYENAIQVIDNGDGIFNEGDYILFYANGPHRIIKDSINKRFSHQFNIYSEESHYFLNFDKGIGKRISLQTNPPIANTTVTSFNDFQFYEKDSVNLGKFGKLWWGDEFSDMPGKYLTRNYSFSVPNIDMSSPLNITTHIGAISYSGANNFSLNVNGNQIQNTALASTGPNFFNPVIVDAIQNSNINVTSSNINITLNFTKGSSTANGFFNFIELNSRRNLVFDGYVNIADWNSVGNGNIAEYHLQNANANTQIWDVTNPLEPIQISTNLNGSNLSFSQEASTLHRFIAIDGSIFYTPSFKEKIANQNLHAKPSVDYIIIVHPSLVADAEKLANYHKEKRGYKTLITTPQEIYNEFSSGTQDVSALRDFVKMFYDKSDINHLPKYLLLFGDASYDYKDRISNNTNFVPTSETNESINKTKGYCSDDFFGFLDDFEDQNNFSPGQINTLDIGVGRFTVSNSTTASYILNKIFNYDSPNSFGPWKNTMTFNADNGDQNTHLNDAEAMAQFVNDSLPNYNPFKIYVGGFNIEATPAGPRAPDANTAVREQIFNGTFLMNYNGHGGPLGWCEERIFSMDDVNIMTNFNRLPLFMTATCDFAPYDNPAINSAGEILLTKSDGGAIGLMTTTQLVYADQNRIMNLNYMKEGFKANQQHQFPTLGDAYRNSKNLRYITSVDDYVASNFRKFALLGDPGLPLAFPKYNIVSDSVNGTSITIKSDTLKALGKYTISGHINDLNGNLLSDFNGVVYPTVFDKRKKISTIDPLSPVTNYYVQNNILYKGKATVKNGKFSFTFVVPKDINYEIAKGKISYYAENGIDDANGNDQGIYVGGSSPNPIIDNQGPVIKAYLNNEKFVNGGIATSNSVLLLHLSDDNGINYTGNSIGHDITAVLDGNAQSSYVLNNFYESDLDNYRSGKVKFPLNNLSEGKHTLRIKAWDIMNNSSEVTLDFMVVNSNKGALAHVYNYPNPFSTHTQFMFEHNMPNQNLFVSIKIMTLSGKVVRNIRTSVQTEGTRVNNIDWDGLDEYGERLANGVYIYNLSVKSQNGLSDNKLEKLILLR